MLGPWKDQQTGPGGQRRGVGCGGAAPVQGVNVVGVGKGVWSLRFLPPGVSM